MVEGTQSNVGRTRKRNYAFLQLNRNRTDGNDHAPELGTDPATWRNHPRISEYPGFAHQEIASKVAARDLKAVSAPLVTATIYANRKAAGLNIGDCFVWNWAEADEAGAGVATSYIMRVSEIAFGDGVDNVVRIQCAQDVFALPDITYVEAEPVVWENPETPPLPASPRLVTETPYYELVRQLGEVDAATKLSGLPEIGF